MATNSNDINFTKEKPFEDGKVLYADDLNDLVTLVKELGDGKTIDIVQEGTGYKLSLHGASAAGAGTVLQKDENGDFVWKEIEANGSGGTGIDVDQLKEYLEEYLENNSYLTETDANQKYHKISIEGSIEATDTDLDLELNSDLTTGNIILVYEA